MSRTAALEPVPLTWENAFGGSDETRSTPGACAAETRNPVGTGFGKPLRSTAIALRLPNIEDPNQLISGDGAVVSHRAASVSRRRTGSLAPALPGTYDEAWNSTRKPLLPADFDRRFFNAAAPGLVAPGYLRGDEEVIVLNATAVPRLAFRLPGVSAAAVPVVLARPAGNRAADHLDTVIVNSDEQLLILLWRAYARVGRGPHDVTAIEVGRRTDVMATSLASSTSSSIGNIWRRRRSFSSNGWPTSTIRK